MHEEMVIKCKLLESIPLHIQKLNYRKGVYANLLLKLGPVGRIPLLSFPKSMIDNV